MVSYISWELIIPVIRLITFRADNVYLGPRGARPDSYYRSTLDAVYVYVLSVSTLDAVYGYVLSVSTLDAVYLYVVP